ncbi:MAG: type II toxin-antitoxin system RelE family toxin [Nitrososphaerales archaeon]
MFIIEIKRRALRKLTELDGKRRERIREIVSILKMDPIPFRKVDVCKLEGYNVYRIRVGDLRIVYEVLWAERKIIIHFVGSMEKAYKLLSPSLTANSSMA